MAAAPLHSRLAINTSSDDIDVEWISWHARWMEPRPNSIYFLVVVVIKRMETQYDGAQSSMLMVLHAAGTNTRVPTDRSNLLSWKCVRQESW
jgi:hypothetical protein